jgi:hypothetical protein
MKEQVSEIELEPTYSELATINFIQQNEILLDLLKEKTKLTINIIKGLSERGNLDDGIKNFLSDVYYEMIVSDKKNLIKYRKYLNETNIKNVSKLPRRYGKNKLNKDIDKQNGRATNVQLTALSVNKLKNIYLKLERLIISEMFSDEKKLTDENYREIRSAIDIVENKLKKIQKNS